MILFKQLPKNLIYSTLILFCSLISNHYIFGQELNCTVKINYEQVNNINQSVFEEMEVAINEFMNNQRWSKDVFTLEEKINCSIFINISSATTTSFKSTINVLATRPVYATNYETTIFNFIDKDVNFVFQQGQPLFFVESNFTSNLTSILAFYAYTILGHDYDSFAKLGGTKFFDKAKEVASFAQQAPNASKGWEIDDKKGRFVLIQNLNNTQFVSYRKNLYLYHRSSLDIFQKNQAAVRTNILKILEDNNKIFDIDPSSLLLRVFFRSKSQELINIFSKGNSTEKQKFLKLVEKLDASNLIKYQTINQ